MMMMTFHNFAGYEFIFACKQPDVTYVTSVYFRGAVKGKVKVKTTELSRFFGASIVSLRGVVADEATLMSPQFDIATIRVAAKLPRLLAVYMM